MPQHISQSVSVCLLNIYIQIKGADHAVLDSYCRFLITAGKALDIDIGGRYSEHIKESHVMKNLESIQRGHDCSL